MFLSTGTPIIHTYNLHSNSKHKYTSIVIDDGQLYGEDPGSYAYRRDAFSPIIWFISYDTGVLQCPGCHTLHLHNICIIQFIHSLCKPFIKIYYSLKENFLNKHGDDFVQVVELLEGAVKQLIVYVESIAVYFTIILS